jgi:hypothetical protein
MEAIMIDAKHKQILRHSLGINGLHWWQSYKIDEEPYRNYFATTEDSRDFPLLQDLVEKDLMYQRKKEMFGETVFHVTKQGVKIAKESAREKVKEGMPTKSKRRYQCYLHCECDESFGEWLKNSYWDETRKQYQV